VLAFIDEFGPLYAVFALYLNDNGVTVSQLSAVFLTWSVTTIALEIPSGAIADRIDRRRVLAAAFALRAVAIVLWLIVPNFAGAMIGAGLWAVHSSLASGAWEAHIHDQLTAHEASGEYPIVMARVTQLGHLGIALASIIATVVLAVGGTFEQLGWMTVAFHTLSVALVSTLPDVNWVSAGEPPTEGPIGEWWKTLKAGVREARSSVDLFRLAILGAFVEGLFIFDEYVPILARDRGASDATVPILVLVVWSSLLVGGEFVARRPDATGRTLGRGLMIATAVMIAALVSSPLWLLTLIGLGYATLQANWVVIDARLQERVGPTTRATVTSVKGFGAGAISGIAFLAIGIATTGTDPRPGLYGALVVLGVIGLVASFWIPDRLPEGAVAHVDTSATRDPTKPTS
jgi:MFS family permease